MDTFTGLKIKELKWFENPREKTLKSGKLGRAGPGGFRSGRWIWCISTPTTILTQENLLLPKPTFSPLQGWTPGARALDSCVPPQAILELGKAMKQRRTVQLVNTEKGKCKTAAQKALAQLGMPCCPTVGQAGQGQMDGQPYYIGCLLGLCIGADCPSHPETLSLLLDEADTKPLEEGQGGTDEFLFFI